MDPMSVTPALLNQYVGGQIQIRENRGQKMYHGGIKALTTDGIGLICVEFSWIAEAQDPAATDIAWVGIETFLWEIDLMYFQPTVAEGRLCFRYKQETSIMYPPGDAKNIDPSVVAGRALQEA